MTGTNDMSKKIEAAKAAVASAGSAGAAGSPPAQPAVAAAAAVVQPKVEKVVEKPEPLPAHNPKEKHYNHRFHGANFVMPDGRVLTFLGGVYKTVKDDVIAELDKVANVPGSYIFTTPAPVIDQNEKNLNKSLKTGAEATFDEVNRLPAGATTIAMPMAATQVTTLSEGGEVTDIKQA